MEKNNKDIETIAETNEEILRENLEYQRIGNRAVHKAQEENRRLGIANWYSINGKIVSDQELEKLNRE